MSECLFFFLVLVSSWQNLSLFLYLWFQEISPCFPQLSDNPILTACHIALQKRVNVTFPPWQVGKLRQRETVGDGVSWRPGTSFPGVCTHGSDWHCLSHSSYKFHQFPFSSDLQNCTSGVELSCSYTEFKSEITSVGHVLTFVNKSVLLKPAGLTFWFEMSLMSKNIPLAALFL